MVRVMKSPNIISTTGRIPVMAAPTANPVKPASEIGVSSTRSLPNSSSKPDKTLKGGPPSATSSPMMQTVLSRRISSAKASRTACANVISLTATSGIHVLSHFIHTRIGRHHGQLNGLLHLRLKFHLNSVQRSLIGDFLFDEPLPKIRYGIAFCPPHLLLLLGAIIFAIDIADVVPMVAIGIA